VTSSRKKVASKAASTGGSAKKHVGDVLGISRARVSKSVQSGGGRPKGIEITPKPRRKGLARAKAVGGVRSR
jgi:predicted transcriptional regulator